MITLVFAFTFLGLVWLAGDVDRSVSNRSAAQSIAFQSARSGAQAASVPELRNGAVAPIDVTAAQGAARRTATTLFAEYGIAGAVTAITVNADTVTVTVSVVDSGRTVTGSGTVRAERAP
jgi:hypothetical protein